MQAVTLIWMIKSEDMTLPKDHPGSCLKNHGVCDGLPVNEAERVLPGSQ